MAQSLLKQESQTRTGVSHPLLGTGLFLLEHPWHTPWPHSLQWCVFSFGVGSGVRHTLQSFISASGTQYSGCTELLMNSVGKKLYACDFLLILSTVNMQISTFGVFKDRGNVGKGVKHDFAIFSGPYLF